MQQDYPMQKFQLDAGKTTIIAENITTVPEGLLLSGANVLLTSDSAPRAYYRHGWQSWSLTDWSNLQPLPVQKPAILHPMQVDPVYVQHPALNGSWLGALELPDGRILLLGALGTDAHVQWREGKLQGWYEPGAAGDQSWFVGLGSEEAVFSGYATFLDKKFGHGRGAKTYRVWCSWYSLYTAIDEQILAKTFQKLGDLPFDVLQVDDGWQIAIGDWQANAKFPGGMEALANGIKATGRRAGLWLAPLLVVPSSRLFREHPDWLLRNEQGQPVSAGFNWGEPLYALDTTHPAALEWLAALMKQVRAWGFDYLKLDFLYAGALPGQRHEKMPREAAYRHGLRIIREAMGADAYFLTCGAPVLPSLGLCDAMRIGPDVSTSWEDYRDAVLLYNPTTPGAKNAIRTTVNRLWLSPLLHTDPDVAYFRSRETTLTAEQKRLLQDLALVCHFKATSDLPQWLTEAERAELRAFLENQPVVTRTGRYTFQVGDRAVDFSPAMPLPQPPTGLNALLAALVGWAGSQSWILSLLNRLGKKNLENLKKSL
jgi:alpha-galactosidase